MFELREQLVPAALMIVAGGLVEELGVVEDEKRPPTS